MSTIKDVAKEAGVSIGTVSKYINGITIRKHNQVAIKKAIEKLDYRINTYAQGLKTNKTNTVTLIIPNIREPFYSSFAHYVSKSLFERNYHLYLCSSQNGLEDELDFIKMANNHKVDGIIAISYSDIENHIDSDIPLVCIDRHFSYSIPCVTTDNAHGGKLAAAKLHECGCKNLLAVRFGSNVYGETNKRITGFMDECERLNLKAKYFEHESDFSSEMSVQEIFDSYVKKLLKNNEFNFDGIFAITDTIAYHIIKVLKRHNISVPNDVQIIGYDGIINPFTGDFFVSTIEQPLEAMAEHCVRILLDENKENIPTLTVFPVKYKFGNTTKL